MTIEADSTFARVIEEHLALKRRNSALDASMPIERYMVDDPFENHPLFKTEEQARLEETLSGIEPEITDSLALSRAGQNGGEAENGDGAASGEDTLWGRSRDFDWGD